VLERGEKKRRKRKRNFFLFPSLYSFVLIGSGKEEERREGKVNFSPSFAAIGKRKGKKDFASLFFLLSLNIPFKRRMERKIERAKHE